MIANMIICNMVFISEAYPIAEIRQYRQECYHLPAFCSCIKVEHEWVEVVGCVAEAYIDVMLYLAGLEREHVAEVEAEDGRHVVVVHA